MNSYRNLEVLMFYRLGKKSEKLISGVATTPTLVRPRVKTPRPWSFSLAIVSTRTQFLGIFRVTTLEYNHQREFVILVSTKIKTCKKAMLAIWFVGRLRNYLSKDHLKMMVNSFLMFLFDYCNSSIMWSSQSRNRFSCNVFRVRRAKRSGHMTPVMKDCTYYYHYHYHYYHLYHYYLFQASDIFEG